MFLTIEYNRTTDKASSPCGFVFILAYVAKIRFRIWMYLTDT